MSRRLILALLCLSSVILFFTQTTSARLSIKVNEAETRCLLKQLAPEFSLAVVNSEPTAADVVIKLDLIDPDAKVLGETERRVQLKPDRIVFYLWPRAGGTSFSFKFKPRMAMKAKAAASTLYDYYNPEARVVIPPGTFLVK